MSLRRGLDWPIVTVACDNVLTCTAEQMKAVPVCTFYLRLVCRDSTQTQTGPGFFFTDVTSQRVECINTIRFMLARTHYASPLLLVMNSALPVIHILQTCIITYASPSKTHKLAKALREFIPPPNWLESQ